MTLRVYVYIFKKTRSQLHKNEIKIITKFGQPEYN